MPTLDVTIRINGQSAKRVYVEHIWKFLEIGAPLGLYITDNNGRVRDNDGNAGIDSFTAQADIRILCQNSVARVLNGAPLLVFPIWVDEIVHNGSIIDLNTTTQKVEHFRILNLAMQNYEDVHRRFPPFSSLPNVDFPLGRQSTLQETKDQTKRIEIVFPDNLPQPRSFCEPMSLLTSYPLIHLKNEVDIPSELPHALHFSLLDRGVRGQVEMDYARFLLSEMAAGREPDHEMSKSTSVMVAYIEAIDHFSSRYSRFIRSQPAGANRPTDFLAAELRDSGPYWLAPSPQAGRLTGNNVTPVFTGGDREGAIYGAIFLDFARRTTLGTAVGSYFRSHAVSFGQYKNWIYINMPQYAARIDEVARTWNL